MGVSKIRDETALVTGGAGFIGSHVSEFLLASGYSVIVLDNLSGGRVSNIPRDAHFVNVDITNSEEVESIFKTNKIDYVFHFAAYAAESLSHFIKHFNYGNNLLGSVNLINSSIKHEIKKYIFASSAAVYGYESKQQIAENVSPIPSDPYGIAKLAVELELQSSYNMFGLPYTIFRFHNVYGERQNLRDPFRNVVGIFIRQALENKPLTIFGSGKQMRQFTYIYDIPVHPPSQKSADEC